MWVKRDWPGDFFIFFLLKDISESILLRKFKSSRLEGDFFKIYFHMYFDPQRSFVAYTGLVIFKISSNLLHENPICDRTPPRQFKIFKKRLLRMNASSRQMVYVNFQNPTCPRDFPGTNFSIFKYSTCG